ncbi:MAG: hypothetical protein MI741_10535, partial [Rhodospirillales bacterium]|nr:hypothetical protein [Rhodospirillales bacterium]
GYGLVVASPSEMRDAGRLRGDALAGSVRAIGHTHLSISSRTFDAIGPVAAPVRMLHDGIARGVYATVAGAHAVAPRAGAVAAAIGSDTGGGRSVETDGEWSPHTTAPHVCWAS